MQSKNWIINYIRLFYLVHSSSHLAIPLSKNFSKVISEYKRGLTVFEKNIYEYTAEELNRFLRCYY